jgi:potassium-dependent mechanosensitive channel
MRLLGLVFLLFFSLSLQAAQNYARYVDANATVYKKLAKTLQNSSGDEAQLQKLLLQKLLATPTDVKKTVAIPVVKTQKEYAEAFGLYLRKLQEKNLQEQHYKTLVKKLQAMQKTHFFSLTGALQYTYYNKLVQNQYATLSATQKMLEELATGLNNSIGTFPVGVNTLHLRASGLEKKIALLFQDTQRLKLVQERLVLLHENNATVTKQLLQNEALEEGLLKKLSTVHFLLFVHAVAHKTDKIAQEEKVLIDTVHKMGQPFTAASVMTLTAQIQNKHLGGFDYLLRRTLQELKNLVFHVMRVATHAIFTINGTQISVLKLIFAITIFIAGFVIGGFYKRKIKSITIHRFGLNIYARTIAANLGNYAIILIAFFIALNTMGISFSSLALVAGALSVGIGFGLQNIVSNFVSGIILMFERSIKVDDYIELPNGLAGQVIDIRMRSTTINTNSNIDVIVPNQNFIQNSVVNWTMNDNIKRLEVPFGVAYGTTPQKIIDVVLEAVKQSGYSDIVETATQSARVFMTGFGDSSVDYALLVWVRGEDIRHTKRLTSRFLILIYNALYANGIEIPFAQRDLHLKSIDKEILSSFSQ